MVSATKELKELIEEYFDYKKSPAITKVKSLLMKEDIKMKLNVYMNTTKINESIKDSPEIAFKELRKGFDYYIKRVMRAVYDEVNEAIPEGDYFDFINSLEASARKRINEVYILINPKRNTEIDKVYIEETYLKLIFLILNTNI